MGLDMERIRQKLDALKNKGNGGAKNIWKPSEEKESQVRLVAYPYGPDPFVELWFHYGIGEGQSILCPKQNSGRACPICDFAQTLRNTKNEADFESFKQVQAKARWYAVVVDRADPKLTPKYWGFSKTV
jgi:hypothetical protein